MLARTSDRHSQQRRPACQAISYSKDFESLYVSNALSETVQQVPLTTNMIVKTARVGGVPGNMAVLPDGKHAYMVRPDGSTVEVLDTSTLEIVDTIDVGMGPSVVTVCHAAVSASVPSHPSSKSALVLCGPAGDVEM